MEGSDVAIVSGQCATMAIVKAHFKMITQTTISFASLVMKVYLQKQHQKQGVAFQDTFTRAFCKANYAH